MVLVRQDGPLRSAARSTGRRNSCNGYNTVMPISIRCIPYREPLIDHVADAAASSGASLDETAVIFASSRAIRHFRKAISERAGKDAIAGPYTYTLDDFIRRSLAPNANLAFPGEPNGNLAFPGEIERRALLNRAIRNCRQDMSPLFRGADRSFLDDFLAFSAIGDRLLRFYDEITLEGVGFDDLRRNCLYTDFEKHVAVLEAVFMQYNRELEANGFIDVPGFKARGQIGDAFNGQFRDRFRRIVVAISGLPTRSELRIIRDISRRVEVAVIMSHEGALLGGHREIAETLGVAIDVPRVNSPLPELAIHEFGDAVTQAGFIAESIGICRRRGIPDERIAVVLPDEGFAGTLMAVLGRDPFNVAMGLPLRESPWMGLLSAASELFASCDDNGFDARALAAFLAQPLVSRIERDEREARQFADMQKEIRDRLLLRVPQKMLEKYPAISGEVERARVLFEANSLRHAASAAFKYLTDVEGRLSPGFRKTLHENRDARSARKQALDLLAECAASTLASEIAGRRSGGGEALSILLATVEPATYPAVNRGGGISVIGLLETRGLSFDAVIMPDMNEGIIPAASRKDMFLNTAIRRAVGLPTPEDREALYGIYLNNLLCGAKTAFLSYVNSSDRPARSRFIEKMLIGNPGLAVAAGSAVEKTWVVPGRFRVSPPPSAARKDEAALARLHDLNHSASSIGAYMSCPYRFYLRYIRRLAEPVIISEELAAAHRGDIFHKAVKALYEGGAGVTDDELFRDAQSHHAMLCDAINREAEKFDQARIVASNRFALENWKGRLAAFSASEVELYRAGWRNVEREKKIEVVSTSGYKLKGTIDRVDRLDDSIRVIDYKTGSLPAKKECLLEGGRDGFRRIQLPFYLLLLALVDGIDPAAVDGLYFYDLKKNFSLVSLHEDFRDDRRAYLRGFTAFIDGVLAEIFDPAVEFRHAQDRRECAWCPYDLSCRVEEV